MKRETVFIVAAGVGLYAIYQAIKGLGDIKDKLADVGSAIGSGLFDFFNPDPTGEMLFYIATFPDGKRHSIPSRTVDAKGKFTLVQFYGNTRWQLLTHKQSKQRYAVKV